MIDDSLNLEKITKMQDLHLNEKPTTIDYSRLQKIGRDIITYLTLVPFVLGATGCSTKTNADDYNPRSDKYAVSQFKSDHRHYNGRVVLRFTGGRTAEAVLQDFDGREGAMLPGTYHIKTNGRYNGVQDFLESMINVDEYASVNNNLFDVKKLETKKLKHEKKRTSWFGRTFLGKKTVVDAESKTYKRNRNYSDDKLNRAEECISELLYAQRNKIMTQSDYGIKQLEGSIVMNK